jgi:arylamine N-acetyltransferase
VIMISFDKDRFSLAAGSFLACFGLTGKIPLNEEALRQIYRAFSNLPYENLSKIIRKHNFLAEGVSSLRTPEEVLEGFLAQRLGGTCFSLTQCLYSLLGFCGFAAYRVLGDMRHGTDIHCAVIADLGQEKYLCDAGYLLPEPLPLSPYDRSELRGSLYTYILEADSGNPRVHHLYTRSPGSSELKWRYRIRDHAVTDSEFEHRWQLSFHDTMMNQIVLTRNLEKGQVYIHKHHLRLNLSDRKQNINIRSSMAEKVKELFGIDSRIVEKSLISLEEERTILTRHQ